MNEYISERKKLYDQALADREAAGLPPTYKMRLRIRLGHKINSDALELEIQMAGRTVTIKSREKEKKISDSEWIVLFASGFLSHSEATEFGTRLQNGIAVSAAIRGRAVDVGLENRATGHFSDRVKEAMARKGAFIIDDIHGLDVYEDLPVMTAIVFGGTATVSTTASQLFDIDPAFRGEWTVRDITLSAALVINAAYLCPDPIGRLALFVSAVEMLCEDVKWTAQQRLIIKEIRRQCSAENCPEDHMNDVRAAINRVFSNRLSIAEKGRRLLDRLGLADRQDDWKSLYNIRSSLFHGGTMPTGPVVVNASATAAELCPRIVRQALSYDMPALADLNLR